MLSFVELSRRFEAVQALQDVTFQVPAGQLVGFVGANGAGKTTAMRIALGIVAPDQGEVRWQDRPMPWSFRRQIGYMPEERGLYPKMRVARQLAYLARLHGIDDPQIATNVGALLAALGLADRADDPVEQLSLGNQQRVQLAAALVHDPAVLILDEPFSGLDPVGVDALADVLRQRVARGVPVLFSSHQLELVERLCDQVVIIDHGRVVAAGPVQELRAGAGARRLRVVVEGAGRGWADQLAAVRVQRAVGDRLDLHFNGADSDEILRAAQAAGTVTHWSFDRPTLAELYRDRVARSQMPTES